MVPPPGRALPYLDWCTELVRTLRDCYRKRAHCARRPPHHTPRAGAAREVVTIREDAGTYWIAMVDVGASMARLCDSDRHDAHTARIFAKSIAGGFDPELSRPER